MPDKKRETALYRSYKIERDTIDEENRCVDLAFASEEPVERWGENEVLSHDKGDYDFSRLNNSHPLLAGHNERDPDAQIGVIEPGTAKVGKDKISRARVRFSKSPKGEQYFQDVKDGIRTNISVGYDRTGIVRQDKAKDGMVTSIFKWMPTHIAIVPVPADTTVGVGRASSAPALDPRPSTLDQPAPVDSANSTEQPAHRAQPKNTDFMADNILTPEKEKEIRDKAVADAREGIVRDAIASAFPATRAKVVEEIARRNSQISARADVLIKDHGMKLRGKLGDEIRTFANEAVQRDSTKFSDAEVLAEFNQRAMDAIVKVQPEPYLLRKAAGEKAYREYSMIEAIASCTRRKSSEPEGLAKETDQDMRAKAKEFGGLGFDEAGNGFMVPQDVLTPAIRSRIGKDQRDMYTGDFGAGGALVPTLMQLPIIELLRNRMVLSWAGIRMLGGLSGNVIIPRQASAANAQSVAEIAALIASDQTFDQISLKPRRVGNTQNYSRLLMLQSSPDVEALIRDDNFAIIGLRNDYLGINGSGANDEPLGIMNQPGVNAINFGGAATYKEIVNMETLIREANIYDEIVYVSTSNARGTLRTAPATLTGSTVVSGQTNALWVGQGDTEYVNGKPAFDSQQIPNDRMIAGSFSQAIFAMWGGLEVVVDPYTRAKFGEIALTINTYIDFALRHPQAFTVSADSAAQ